MNPSGTHHEAPPQRKRINLALQGGGTHGAFTWGVLDRLMEDDRLEIDGICGTSAGAINAAVLASGLAQGGASGARASLDRFWREVSAAALWSPLHPTPLDRVLSPGNMDFSPAWLLYDSLSRMISPYVANPSGINPLRAPLEAVVDFELLRRVSQLKLFLCATNVKTGRIKVFADREIGPDAVLASACLPSLFQAVEIDGEAYWDGGYLGNPPIFPLIYGTGSEDILIIQINPITINHVPRTATEILDRINELSFNSSLMGEMRAIHFVQRLLEDDRVPRFVERLFGDDGTARGRYKDLKIHTIDAEAEMRPLGYSSKLNTDLDFLLWLFELGRERADRFLERHYDQIGVESSTDIVKKYL